MFQNRLYECAMCATHLPFCALCLLNMSTCTYMFQYKECLATSACACTLLQQLLSGFEYGKANCASDETIEGYTRNEAMCYSILDHS